MNRKKHGGDVPEQLLTYLGFYHQVALSLLSFRSFWLSLLFLTGVCVCICSPKSHNRCHIPSPSLRGSILFWIAGICFSTCELLSSWRTVVCMHAGLFVCLCACVRVCVCACARVRVCACARVRGCVGA